MAVKLMEIGVHGCTDIYYLTLLWCVVFVSVTFVIVLPPAF